jgi:phage shock protein PspC (stress-responsive transcriptional regulator)
MARRLKRDTKHAVLGGVAAGLGNYIDLDPVLIRLLFVILCLAGGSGVIIYVVCWLVMPRDDEVQGESFENAAPQDAPPGDRFAEEVREAGERVAESVRGASGKVVDNLRRSSAGDVGKGRLIGGLILMALGFLFLMNQLFSLDWLRFRYIWPLAIVVVGVMLFIQGMRSRDE